MICYPTMHYGVAFRFPPGPLSADSLGLLKALWFGAGLAIHHFDLEKDLQLVM